MAKAGTVKAVNVVVQSITDRDRAHARIAVADPDSLVRSEVPPVVANGDHWVDNPWREGTRSSAGSALRSVEGPDGRTFAYWNGAGADRRTVSIAVGSLDRPLMNPKREQLRRELRDTQKSVSAVLGGAWDRPWVDSGDAIEFAADLRRLADMLDG